MLEVRGRLLAARAARDARLRSGPGAPHAWRDVGPTLTERGEARVTARLIDSTHPLVPSPVQRRSGRLPPRPPGPLRVLELCFGTASAMAAPLWGLHRRGVSPAGLLIPFFLFLLRAGRRVCLVCACRARVCARGGEGQGRAGRGPNVGWLVGAEEFEEGSRRGEWAVGVGVAGRRAYGVAVTFLPHKGGAVPESERRRAAWRITEPSHTCSCSSFAVPSPHLFPT